MRLANVLCLSLILLCQDSLAADNSTILSYGARFHPVVSPGGMVVSQEAVASQVGAEILAAGGNAVDAAVATGFALAVTLPQAGNIGGGGFMLVHLAAENKTIAIDYRETAPAAAHRDLFLDSDGEVDNELARFSHRSAGVPGTVAGMVLALNNYGTMSLKDVLKPAIKLAEQGFTVGFPLAYSLDRRAKQFAKYPASAGYYLDDQGTAHKAGKLWRQADLAWSLKQIAAHGNDGFYKGPVADKIVAQMQQGDGLITHADLAAYRAIERQPVTGTYHGFKIASMPPPSSGGIHLVQMLNILEGWDLPAMGHNSTAYIHHLAETMRRAYADRSQYLGDPDFYPVPVEKLIDKGYAKSLREGISATKATPSSEVAPALDVYYESPQTTQYSVWDKHGNAVSNTYTLNFSYGSGIAVAGAGFLLNNEMDDFSSKPGSPNGYGLVGGDANAIEGGKRPLSSMTPTLVFKDNKAVMATGSPGGSTIITVVLQNILNFISFEMNIAEASAAPRIHHQWLPDALMLESGINKDTRQQLEAMGHTISTRKTVLGRVQSISSDGEYRFGVSDSRWPGGAAVPE
ncbi:MAG: gamma-glutamyltransferase [Pseudomonadales bacterium]